MKMFTWSEVARQMLGCPSQRSTILIFKYRYASRKEGEQKNNEKKIPISLTLSVKITLQMQI